MTHLLVIFRLLLILVPVSLSAQTPNNLQIPGKLVTVDGHQMHLHCEGIGTPTVVLDAGLGGNSLDWIRVQPEVAKFSRVCSYDRAGYGWSEPGPLPRTSEVNARELHALLSQAAIPGPYVLVGHSYGGFNIRLFASLFPEDTAGIVLVESSHEDQFQRFRSNKVSYNTAPANRNAVFFYSPPVVPENMPAEMKEIAASLMSSYTAYQAARREMISFLFSAEQVRQTSIKPDIPLVVVTRGQRVWPQDSRGETLEKIWHDLQDELASHVVGLPHLYALQGGHHVHLDEPEVVINAIRIVIKTGGRLL